ncbi:MAG: YihY/virulence factor BrkB family protein [Chloroflexota bacterium]|nr:YihY/virulence factor BrkB family protein [Chloroflexota bacterium]
MTGDSINNRADRAHLLYDWANGFIRGSFDILRDAIKRFGDARAGEAAASIAFFAIFSLFPLLLALIIGGSFILESKLVQQWILDVVDRFFPVAQQLIERNIRGVLELRGTVGLVAFIGLTWSATGALTILTRNINRAWTEASPRNFFQDRLVALGMIGGMAALLVSSSILSAALDVLSRLDVPVVGDLAVNGTPLWASLLGMMPRLFVFLALLGLYRWTPNTQVRWSEAFWGALVATPAGEIATNGFTWYLSSGVVRYELIYGSLGAMVALMLWIYIGVLIILFGAHISAAIARRRGG